MGQRYSNKPYKIILLRLKIGIFNAKLVLPIAVGVLKLILSGLTGVFYAYFSESSERRQSQKPPKLRGGKPGSKPMPG